jgi:tight adherence protein B
MAQVGIIAIVLLAASAAALLVAFFLWNSVSAEVNRRVDVLAGGMAARALENRGEIPVPYSELDILKYLFTLGMPRKWGVDARPLTFALASLTAGATAWLLSQAMHGLPVWIRIALVALCAWLGPHLLARMEQGKAEKRFVDLFPDAIDMIVRMLRASLPVGVAIRTVGKEAPAPINCVFSSLADQIEIGITFEDALGIGSQRIGLPDFRFFAAAVALQHTTGGNLITTLEILGEIIRRRHAIRMKARAATAEVRMSAYVLGSMPFFVFGALFFVNPKYLTPLFVDPRGKVILVVSFSLLLGAFVTMRRMMRSVTSA